MTYNTHSNPSEDTQSTPNNQVTFDQIKTGLGNGDLFRSYHNDNKDERDRKALVHAVKSYLQNSPGDKDAKWWEVFEATYSKIRFNGWTGKAIFDDKQVTLDVLLDKLEDALRPFSRKGTQDFLKSKYRVFCEKREFNPVKEYLEGLDNIYRGATEGLIEYDDLDDILNNNPKGVISEEDWVKTRRDYFIRLTGKEPKSILDGSDLTYEAAVEISKLSHPLVMPEWGKLASILFGVA